MTASTYASVLPSTTSNTPYDSSRRSTSTKALRSARTAGSKSARTESVAVAVATRSASIPIVITGTVSSSAATTQSSTYRRRSNGARPDRSRRAGRVGSVAARTLNSRA